MGARSGHHPRGSSRAQAFAFVCNCQFLQGLTARDGVLTACIRRKSVSPAVLWSEPQGTLGDSADLPTAASATRRCERSVFH
jgi:hypothetical protein